MLRGEKMPKVRDIEKAILELLKRTAIGLTTSDLAEKLGVSRLTVMKYLQSLKGKGVIIDRKVGAYKLWFLKETLDTRKRLISKRLACILAVVFAKIFPKRLEEIAFNVGKNLATEFIKRYPDDYFLLEKIPKSSFEKIALAIEFISEDLRVDGFEIEENRGIIRIVGPLCNDDTASLSLINLIAGAIVGYLETDTKKKAEIVSKKIKKSNGEFDIVFEIALK